MQFIVGLFKIVYSLVLYTIWLPDVVQLNKHNNIIAILVIMFDVAIINIDV